MSRRRKRKSDDVELNLAAMLDMAFQLLTFFILTFRPPPAEGQISLRLPPPRPALADPKSKIDVGQNESKDAPKGLNTLVVSLFADPNGNLAGLSVGETPIQTLPGLDTKLQSIFSDKDNPFDQVIVQVGEEVKYDDLMKVIEICAKQKLPNGDTLHSLSFVENPK